ELIMATMRRYFHLDHVRYLGGALAYELLCFNDGFFDGADHSSLVQTLLDADASYMADDPEPNSLFVFALGRPNKDALLDVVQLAQWEQEEDEREAFGERNGGRYYADTMLGEYFEVLEQARLDARLDVRREDPRVNCALVRHVGSAVKRSARELTSRIFRRS
ncbi:MAG: hypothetical protein ABMA25_27575, partial [Ilumatobacteraceae bacterium]